MKSTKHLLLLSLSILFILNSCSIEKRKYTTGYYIDWKGSKHKTEKTTAIKDDNIAKEEVSRPQEEREIAKETTEKRMAENETAIASSDNAIQLSSSKTFSLLKEKLNIIKSKHSSLTDQDTIKNKKEEEKIETTEDKPDHPPLPPKQLNKLVFWGFCTVLIGFILLSVAAFQTVVSPFLLVLSLVVIIGGFIVIEFAIAQINHDPDRYWGIGFAVAGIILSGAIILSCLIALIGAL